VGVWRGEGYIPVVDDLHLSCTHTLIYSYIHSYTHTHTHTQTHTHIHTPVVDDLHLPCGLHCLVGELLCHLWGKGVGVRVRQYTVPLAADCRRRRSTVVCMYICMCVCVCMYVCMYVCTSLCRVTSALSAYAISLDRCSFI
jgi:hypothetical protein